MKFNKNMISLIIVFVVLLFVILIKFELPLRIEDGVDFYIKYEKQTVEPPHGKVVINLFGNGIAEYILYEDDSMKDYKKEQYSISNERLISVLKFAVEEKNFFNMPKDISVPDVMDGSKRYIEIMYKGRVRKVGGYNPYVSDKRSNKDFKSIVDKIYEVILEAEGNN